MTIRLIICPDHVLLDDWMRVLHTSRHTNSVNLMIIEKLICHSITICCVNKHIGNLRIDELYLLFDIHHYQSKLLVSINNNRFCFFFWFWKIYESVCITIKWTAFRRRNMRHILCRILSVFVNELSSTVIIQKLFLIILTVYQNRLENMFYFRYKLWKGWATNTISTINNYLRLIRGFRRAWLFTEI